MRVLAALALSLILVSSVFSQAFPAKPARLIVGFSPGGGVDITARIVAAKLSEIWGQQLIVENRVGAGGTIGAEMVARAAPDGYTLVLCNVASHGIAPSLYKKLGYDAVKNFTPISLVGTTANVMVVHPSVPARSVAEFIAYAKANPGKISYGSAGVGTTLHLSVELFKSMTGTDLVHVPYKGGAQALADLIGGQVQLMIANLPEQIAHIKTGKTRALGVTTTTRSRQLPDVPTIAESGVPGFDVVVWYGVCGPAGLPKPVLEKLNGDVVKALSSTDMKQKLTGHGIEPGPMAPEQFASFIRSDIAKWAKVVKESGVTGD